MRWQYVITWVISLGHIPNNKKCEDIYLGINIYIILCLYIFFSICVKIVQITLHSWNFIWMTVHYVQGVWMCTIWKMNVSAFFIYISNYLFLLLLVFCFCFCSCCYVLFKVWELFQWNKLHFNCLKEVKTIAENAKKQPKRIEYSKFVIYVIR